MKNIQTTRRPYLDDLRWGTVVLVALYHVFYIFNAVTPGMMPFAAVQYQDGAQYLLYPWFMILLFVIAGMCARYALETRSLRDFIRTRTRRLLVPSTIGVLVFGWVQGGISMAIAGAFEDIGGSVPVPILFLIQCLSGTGVLWFIQMLWLFSMLLALVRRFEKGRLYALTSRCGVIAALLLGVPVWLFGQIGNTPVIAVYRFGIYGFTFFLGYFVFAHDEVVDRLAAARIPLLLAAAVLGGVYLVRHFGDNYAVMPVVGCVLATAYGWVAVLALLGAGKAWLGCGGAVSHWMTQHEFGLYVFHYLPLSATALLLHRADVPALPCYLLTAVAAFAGAFLLEAVISRIPVLRWCILGIKKVK